MMGESQVISGRSRAEPSHILLSLVVGSLLPPLIHQLAWCFVLVCKLLKGGIRPLFITGASHSSTTFCRQQVFEEYVSETLIY